MLLPDFLHIRPLQPALAGSIIRAHAICGLTIADFNSHAACFGVHSDPFLATQVCTYQWLDTEQDTMRRSLPRNSATYSFGSSSRGENACVAVTALFAAYSSMSEDSDDRGVREVIALESIQSCSTDVREARGVREEMALWEMSICRRQTSVERAVRDDTRLCCKITQNQHTTKTYTLWHFITMLSQVSA